jgi:hypothetical protein
LQALYYSGNSCVESFQFQSQTTFLGNNYNGLSMKGHNRNVKNSAIDGSSEWRHNNNIHDTFFKPHESATALSATNPALGLIEPTTTQSISMFQHEFGTRILLCMDGDGVPATVLENTAATSGTATWRQYVVLAVILAVLADILLGSPVAGAIAAPLRQQADDLQEQEVKKNSPLDTSRERVDSEAMAKQVLDKVYGTQELKDYLERNKSDKDRMEEMRQKVDRQFEDMN